MLLEHVVDEEEGGAVVLVLVGGEGVVAAGEPAALERLEVVELADFAEYERRHVCVCRGARIGDIV